MSSRSWRFRIQDILAAIKNIETYTEDLTSSQFIASQLIMDGVARNLEIIGEASRFVPLTIRNLYPDVPWNLINDMRNVLIHEYFNVHVNNS